MVVGYNPTVTQTVNLALNLNIAATYANEYWSPNFASQNET
jgi:hypothetical protein